MPVIASSQMRGTTRAIGASLLREPAAKVVLLIQTFRCVMLFLLVWSATWYVVVVVVVVVVAAVIVVVVVVPVTVPVVIVIVAAGVVVDVLFFGCKSRSASDRPCGCCMLWESMLLSFVVAVCVVVVSVVVLCRSF